MEDLWVSVQLSASSLDRIETIQQAIAPVIPEWFIKESDPHLSLLPGISLPRDEIARFTEIVDAETADLEMIQISGIDWHPAESPYVVHLDVETDIDEIRRSLLSAVKTLGGELRYEPVSPHITLYKSGDGPTAEQITDLEGLAQKRSQLARDDTIETHWKEQECSVTVLQMIS